MKQVFVIQDAYTNEVYNHGSGWVASLSEATQFTTHAAAMQMASAIIETGIPLQIQTILIK